MKLSRMRDGAKKSVTVPEIPGQLGPIKTLRYRVQRRIIIIMVKQQVHKKTQSQLYDSDCLALNIIIMKQTGDPPRLIGLNHYRT